MKNSVIPVFILSFFYTVCSTPIAQEFDDEYRTTTLNEEGESTIISLQEFDKGKNIFINTCSQCHEGGTTKTNPNVNLSLEALSLAYPPRDNINNLIDYFKNPTTYDGEIEIYEFHPSIRSADIYPEMRNLSEEDLYALAGFILIQAKSIGRSSLR